MSISSKYSDVSLKVTVNWQHGKC